MSKVPGIEFADDGSLIQPLILALVSETGPECYAVFADGGMNAAAGNGWLRTNVIPHLPVALAASGRSWAWDAGHADYPQVRPHARIAAEVRSIIAGQPEPEAWPCYSPYDAAILCQLCGPMNALRARLPCSPGTSCNKPAAPGPPSWCRPRRRTAPCATHGTTASSPRPLASHSKGAL